MKLTNTQALELGASVAWLAMDFTWMLKVPVLSFGFAAVMVSATTAAMLAYRGNGRGSGVEYAALGATIYWAVMNACWMASDFLPRYSERLLRGAKQAGVFAFVFMAVSGALALAYRRGEALKHLRRFRHDDAPAIGLLEGRAGTISNEKDTPNP